jgi:hypothetical protein
MMTCTLGLAGGIARIGLFVNRRPRCFPIGHRILGGPRVKRCNSTLAALPGDHLSLTRAPGSKFLGIPPDARSPPNFHHKPGR